MSNSHGAVKFTDGTIKYFEYWGTVDVCNPILRDSLEDVSDHWRVWDKDYNPNCRNIINHLIEYIEIAVEYGGGMYWNGRACRECKLITSALHPDYDNGYHDGLPDWYPNKKEIEEYFK